MKREEKHFAGFTQEALESIFTIRFSLIQFNINVAQCY